MLLCENTQGISLSCLNTFLGLVENKNTEFLKFNIINSFYVEKYIQKINPSKI